MSTFFGIFRKKIGKLKKILFLDIFGIFLECFFGEFKKKSKNVDIVEIRLNFG